MVEQIAQLQRLKALVLNSVSAPITKRVYNMPLDQFLGWFRQEPPAASLTPRTPPDERITLVFALGANSYPLINYEYATVSETQPNAQVAAAISNFLLWCISPQGGS